MSSPFRPSGSSGSTGAILNLLLNAYMQGGYTGAGSAGFWSNNPKYNVNAKIYDLFGYQGVRSYYVGSTFTNPTGSLVLSPNDNSPWAEAWSATFQRGGVIGITMDANIPQNAAWALIGLTGSYTGSNQASNVPNLARPNAGPGNAVWQALANQYIAFIGGFVSGSNLYGLNPSSHIFLEWWNEPFYSLTSSGSARGATNINGSLVQVATGAGANYIVTTNSAASLQGQSIIRIGLPNTTLEMRLPFTSIDGSNGISLSTGTSRPISVGEMANLAYTGPDGKITYWDDSFRAIGNFILPQIKAAYPTLKLYTSSLYGFMAYDINGMGGGPAGYLDTLLDQLYVITNQNDPWYQSCDGITFHIYGDETIFENQGSPSIIRQSYDFYNPIRNLGVQGVYDAWVTKVKKIVSHAKYLAPTKSLIVTECGIDTPGFGEYATSSIRPTILKNNDNSFGYTLARIMNYIKTDTDFDAMAIYIDQSLGGLSLATISGSALQSLRTTGYYFYGPSGYNYTDNVNNLPSANGARFWNPTGPWYNAPISFPLIPFGIPTGSEINTGSALGGPNPNIAN